MSDRATTFHLTFIHYCFSLEHAWQGKFGVSSRIDASVKYIVRILEVDEHGERGKIEKEREIMRER